MLAFGLTGVYILKNLLRQTMKKTITIILTILSLLLILDSVNFSHALMMFLLAGVIPGTNIAIDGAQMLEFVALVAGFIVARLTAFVIRSSRSHVAPALKVHA